MSQHHIWDTPLLFVATLAGLLAVGAGASHGMEWLHGTYLPAISWGMAGASLVFTFGHAKGVGRFELSHLRLVFLAAAAFFIHLFLALMAGILVMLFLWFLVTAFLEGDLF